VRRISKDQAVAELKAIIREDGIRAGLIFLNGLTEHRFSALYQFADHQLRNLYFFDREYPDVESAEEIPVTASYCVFLRDTGQLFHTSDALRDDRVRSHPKREQIQAYCGVPVLDAEGKLFGSICHFDLQPRVIADEDVDLMEAVARLLRDEPWIRARSLATA
jgi:GAF domain-containing protein